MIHLVLKSLKLLLRTEFQLILLLHELIELFLLGLKLLIYIVKLFLKLISFIGVTAGLSLFNLLLQICGLGSQVIDITLGGILLVLVLNILLLLIGKLLGILIALGIGSSIGALSLLTVGTHFGIISLCIFGLGLVLQIVDLSQDIGIG